MFILVNLFVTVTSFSCKLPYICKSRQDGCYHLFNTFYLTLYHTVRKDEKMKDEQTKFMKEKKIDVGHIIRTINNELSKFTKKIGRNVTFVISSSKY